MDTYKKEITETITDIPKGGKPSDANDKIQVPFQMTSYYYNQLHLIMISNLKSQLDNNLIVWFETLTTLIRHTAPNVKQRQMEYLRDRIKKLSNTVVQVRIIQETTRTNKSPELIKTKVNLEQKLFNELDTIQVRMMYLLNSRGMLIQRVEHRGMELLYTDMGIDMDTMPDLNDLETKEWEEAKSEWQTEIDQQNEDNEEDITKMKGIEEQTPQDKLIPIQDVKAEDTYQK